MESDALEWSSLSDVQEQGKGSRGFPVVPVITVDGDHPLPKRRRWSGCASDSWCHSFALGTREVCRVLCHAGSGLM